MIPCLTPANVSNLITLPADRPAVEPTVATAGLAAVNAETPVEPLFLAPATTVLGS